MTLINVLKRLMETYILENPLRRLIQDPYKVLEEIKLLDAAVLLDVGCGTGFISIPAAQVVGPTGHVYAVDIDEKRLAVLEKRAEERGLKNITPIKTEAWSISQIVSGTVDFALMFFSLHHFSMRKESLGEVAEKLKSGGRLLIYDPIASRLVGHGTSPEEVLKICTEIGLVPESLKKGVLTYRLALIKP